MVFLSAPGKGRTSGKALILQAICRLAVLCGILLTGTASGQQTSGIDPVLQQAVAKHKRILGEAQKYSYSELYKSLASNSSGKTKVQFTDTYDILFLEGAPYKKHVLHNDLPLPEREQKAEDKKLAEVTKARRNERQSKGLLHANFRFEFPLDQLPSRFDIKPDEPETLEGRRTLVFTATPKVSDSSSLRQAVRDGVAYQMKLWVDQEDGVFSKIEGQAVADGMRYEKGTYVTYQFRKVNEEAWLPVRFWFKGKVRYMMSDVPAEAEQTYSNYKKFSADSKLIPE